MAAVATRLLRSGAAVAIAAFPCIFGGCSSSSGGAPDGGAQPGAFTGLIGCDAGSAPVTTECALTIPLSGGLNTTLSNFQGCSSSSVSLSWSGSLDALDVTMTFLGASPPIDQLGSFGLQGLDIVNPPTGLRWSAPPGGCTVTIEGSVCSPTAVFMHRRVLSGAGAVAQGPLRRRPEIPTEPSSWATSPSSASSTRREASARPRFRGSDALAIRWRELAALPLVPLLACCLARP